MPIKSLITLFLTILLLILFPFKVNSNELIKSIDVVGNDRISKESIIIFSGVKINDEIELNETNKILKKIYETNFFRSVKTSLVNNKLIISVEENPIIGEIKIEGIKAKRIVKILKDNISLKSRSSYSEFTVKRDVEIIYDVLKNLGYYFSNVNLLLADRSKNIIDITYEIDLGDKSKINKIIFTGNKAFKENKLKSIITSEEYKFWKIISGRKYLLESTVNLDKRLLKNFYLNKGYYNVKINSSFAKLNDKSNFELIFNITEGEKYFFNNLNLNIPVDFNKENYNEVYDLFSSLSGKPYSILRIEKIINLIDRISTNEQFISINSTVKESIVNNKIDLIFEVAETEKFVIKKINFSGNNVTRENVLRNQLVLDEGDPYNEILALKSVNNLKALNFFKDVEFEVIDLKNGFKEINIKITEKPTGEISAGAGVGTSGATIGFGVKENNYLGKGIGLNTNLTLTEDSIKGLIYIRNPNFRNTDKSVNFSVEATEIDKLTDFGYKTSKSGFTLGTGFEYYDDLNFGIGLSTYYESVEADSTASDRQKKQAGNYFDIFTNLNFNYDKRDQKFQSTDGFLSKYTINLPILSDSNTLSNLYTFSNYYEYLDKNIFKTSVYLKSSNSLSGDNIKLSERNYIPSTRLRGFEFGKVGPKDGDDYVGGNYIATINFSSTVPQFFPNLQSTDLSVFVDIANMWGVDYDSSLESSDDIRSSIGIGLDWFSPIGPINFTLAQPLSKSSNDKTETFRFNLGTTF